MQVSHIVNDMLKHISFSKTSLKLWGQILRGGGGSHATYLCLRQCICYELTVYVLECVLLAHLNFPKLIQIDIII